MIGSPTGLDAFGHPVPSDRQLAAARHLHSIAPDMTGHEISQFIARACKYIQLDDPIRILGGGAADQYFKLVDYTGRVRVLSVLMTEVTP